MPALGKFLVSVLSYEFSLPLPLWFRGVQGSLGFIPLPTLIGLSLGFCRCAVFLFHMNVLSPLIHMRRCKN